MKLTEKSKETIEQVHLLSGRSQDDVKLFFTTLVQLLTLNYLEGKGCAIPYIGQLKVVYEGEVIRSKGKEAKLGVKFDPDASLLRIVGQIADGVETDIEADLSKSIKKALELYIQ